MTPDQPSSAYQQQAGLRDQLLDYRLADIRQRQQSGVISVRQAADERIAVLEDHLAALRELRALHFGTDQGRPR